ncbi:MAG: hypothetical protein H6Q33_2075 [Deltaproteobacteria bacterium]|nr:hypothetical protein [Deltaproteobacteria bacterium]
MLALGVYSSTLSAFPSWDSLRHAADMTLGRPAGLAGGHHLAGGLFVYGLQCLAQRAGLLLEPLRVLQQTSACFAAICLGSLYALLRTSGASVGVAAFVALGLGSSRAFWEAATDGEVYAVAAALLVVAWWGTLFAPRTLAGAAGAGAVAALAILGHQCTAVLALCSPFWFWRRERSFPFALTYVMSCGAVAACGYLLAWWVSGWGQNGAALYKWLTLYLRLGFHFPPSNRILGAAQGFVMSMVFPPGPFATFAGPGWGLRWAAMGLVLAAVASVWAVGLTSAWQTGPGAPGRLIVLVAFGTGALASWWEPNTGKFWVPALVCSWLAIGIGLARRPIISPTAVAAMALALAVINTGGILPRTGVAFNPLPSAARQIAQATAPGDLIITSTDILGPSLAYYGARPHVTNLFALALEARYRNRDVQQQLLGAVAAARQRQAAAFIASDALALPSDRRRLVPALPGTLRELVSPMQLRQAFTYTIGQRQHTLFEIVDPAPQGAPKAVRSGVCDPPQEHHRP